MQLPYEIWKMITAYLPVGGAKGLYSVNSALFDIAMDIRYQEARLWTGSPKAHVRRDLRVFQYPHLSSRPKTLSIDLSSFGKSLSLMNKGGCHSLGRAIPLFFDFLTRRKFNSVHEIVAIALDALSRLSGVTKVHITYGYNGACRDDPLILRLIKDIWQILGHRLQSLQARVAFENLKILFPTSLHLPHLEMLTIVTDCEWGRDITANGYEATISAMIQTHRSTLCDLSFTTTAAIDFRPICQSLRDVPHLRTIHLSVPFHPFGPRPLLTHDLLYSCRHRLECLSLNFETFTREHATHSSSLFLEDWCSVDFPRLRILKINPPMMGFGQKFVDYVHQFAPSLVSLSIGKIPTLRYHEVEQLILHDFSALRHLSMCIRCLCPDILALLARSLPRLQTLDLTSLLISPTTNEEWFNEPELSRLFYQAMQRQVRIFREWQLASLDCWIHSQSTQIEKALTDHLPNVKWFRGEERSVYLSKARKLRPIPLLSPDTMSYAML